jgi:hypothetical protein
LRLRVACIIFCNLQTKTGRHDKAETLLKVALNTKNQIIIKYFLDILMAEITDIVSLLYDSSSMP